VRLSSVSPQAPCKAARLTGELDADAAGSFRGERLEDLRVGTCVFDGGAQVCLLLAAQVDGSNVHWHGCLTRSGRFARLCESRASTPPRR
jgi:hypothetical protein